MHHSVQLLFKLHFVKASVPFPYVSCDRYSGKIPGLKFDFDNMWKTRFEPSDKFGAERFLAEGGLAGRRKDLKTASSSGR